MTVPVAVAMEVPSASVAHSKHYGDMHDKRDVDFSRESHNDETFI